MDVQTFDLCHLAKLFACWVILFIHMMSAPLVTKVFCNPPFHQQNAITDHIAWQMFHDAYELLNKGGHLIVVANRHLDYYPKLKRLFGGVNTIANDRKFVIYSAAKR